MTKTVVTRFAPSPTGYLHIGGARTALFNWAYARAKGGRFLLRIEDTDKDRSTQAAIDAIISGLNWLGLAPDEAPLFQSKQQARHVEVADQLLKSGHAYRSYADASEIEAIRQKAREDGVAARYPGRDVPIASELIDQSVVRFKAPSEGETVIEDEVQGRVSIRNDQLDDLVLLRSDGSPTYMLAVVVDDHDMGITHVIRGDDHLTNAAKQIQIYEALSWDLPIFAHIPLIHGADGAKLSKRHGALGVEAYQTMGYLTEALRNYLARLGWSHGDEEIISTEQLVEWFDIEGINKAPARFDMAKLDHINGHYIRESDPSVVIDEVKILLDTCGDDLDLSFKSDRIDFEKLQSAFPFLKERAKTLIELLETAAYLFTERPVVLSDKAKTILSNEGAAAILSSVADCLTSLQIWDKESLERELKAFSVEKELKFGKIAPLLRCSLTGSTVSPGIYDILLSLGRDESLSRIQDQVSVKTG